MIIGDESNDIEEFKEGDCVILNHLLEGTVEYISKMGFAEVFSRRIVVAVTFLLA